MAAQTTIGGERRIVATYPYYDEGGSLLYEVVRFEPKSFAQRRPDGNGGFTWGLDGQRRVPYRLHELLAAPSDAIVFVTEGEKDADRLAGLGLTATCNPGGAGKWSDEYSSFLQSRHVAVLADNDGVGWDHAEKVARSILSFAGSVKVITLIDLPPKGDISDWLDAGHTIEELHSIIERTPTCELSPDAELTSSAPKPAKKSAAVRLVEVLADDTELFHTPSGDEYASVSIDGHRETHKIKSVPFRQYLRRQFYQEEQKAPSASAVQDAVELIAARARFDGHEQEVYLRTAPRSGGGCWLDLCDSTWSAIEITVSGWRIVENPPVRFRRAPGMLSLPVPQGGESLDEIDGFLNVKSPDDKVLLRTWLTAGMRPEGPYPVLCIHGEHGAAKSTAVRVLRSLVDPSAAPLSAAPRDERDLMIAAKNSWFLSLDNLSRLDGWLSDAICRLATGGGLRTRMLYEDTAEVIFSATRPIVLNGIEAVATRGDLVDRSVTIYLEPIDPVKRREESEFWSAFEAARPRILGALLDGIVGGLRGLSVGVALHHKPRMADFAAWATAAEQSLGFAAGAFMIAYAGNRADTNTLALDSSPVASAILGMLSSGTGWSGTAGELLEKLEPLAGAAAREKSWPGSPRALAGTLRRLAPNLREAGVVITFAREGHARHRIIGITRKENAQSVVRTVRMSPSASIGADDFSQPAETAPAAPSAVSASKHALADCADDADGQEHLLSPVLVSAKTGRMKEAEV